MSDNPETPVHTFQVTAISGVAELADGTRLPVGLDVATGVAVVTLPDGTTTSQVVLTTHGDLVAAAIGAASAAMLDGLLARGDDAEEPS